MIWGMGDESAFDLSLKFSYIFVVIGVFDFDWMFVKGVNIGINSPILVK